MINKQKKIPSDGKGQSKSNSDRKKKEQKNE